MAVEKGGNTGEGLKRVLLKQSVVVLPLFSGNIIYKNKNNP